MKQKVWGVSLGLMLCAGALYAGNETKPAQKAGEEAKLKSIEAVENNRTVENEPKKSRLTLGGYGEAVYSRNFYSDHY